MAVYKRTYKDQGGKSSVVYWIDFYFHGRRYRRPVGENRKAAKEALDRIQGRIASGDFDPGELKAEAAGVAFDRALELYLEHRFAQGKGATSYENLSRYWKPLFAKRLVKSITSEEIDTALSRWSDAHAWSPATRNRVLAELSGALSYCYGRRWIDAHPTERGRVPKLAVENACTRWLRVHEIDALVTAAPGWMKPVLRFTAMSGMRLGEVCGLRRASYQEDENGRAYVVTEKTKNGERLVWPLEGAALEIICEAVARSKFPGSYLFVGPRGGSAKVAVRDAFPGVARAAGLKYGRKEPEGVTFHTLRHSMASLALNAGIPEVVVQRMGNWKSRVMVARYAHLSDETLRDAAGKLADMVGGSSSGSHAPVTVHRKGKPAARS